MSICLVVYKQTLEVLLCSISQASNFFVSEVTQFLNGTMLTKLESIVSGAVVNFVAMRRLFCAFSTPQIWAEYTFLTYTKNSRGKTF